MKDTNLVAVYADDVFVTVVVEEKNGAGRHQPADDHVLAKDMQLKQWTVTDPQGYDTTVAVYNLDTSKPPDRACSGSITRTIGIEADNCRPRGSGPTQSSAGPSVDTGCPALAGQAGDDMLPSMPLKIATWNINSVRLRIDLVAKFIKSARPDVLCLQETKCPDDAFPLKRFARLGYEHVALNGQKGYHGVAVVSRLPFESNRHPELLRQDRLPPHLGRAGRARRPERSADAA